MKNKFIKSLAILSATVGLAACGAGATSDSSEGSVANIEDKTTVDTIKENDVIRIGVFGDKPPFSYVDANGDNQGFDVEISKKIAEDLLG
jgi:polar amino acid transport system substrate-binding protein